MSAIREKYEAVIGLEVHAQLLTLSKMFCGCAADYLNAPSNSRLCPICMGMPGAMPAVNEKAVEFGIMTGLALNCSIPNETKFDRKNYPYPDLMKGYQITQYDQPVGSNGWLVVGASGDEVTIRINRVHLEEDVAKATHIRPRTGDGYSLLDVNRAGVPLMETVSEPDLRSPEQAREYLIKLREIFRYLGVSAANMDEGSFRCDANISLRPKGVDELFPKVEIKNMNSLRSIVRALEYEIGRQSELMDAGVVVIQETRGWLETEGITISQRIKGDAHDYRYFPEPDLPVIDISRSWVEKLRGALPVLPEERLRRLKEEFGLGLEDAGFLVADKHAVEFFENVLAQSSFSQQDIVGRSRNICNWITGEMTRLFRLSDTTMKDCDVVPAYLSRLQDLVDDSTLTMTMAKSVFGTMFETGDDPDTVVGALGMTRVGDSKALAPVVDEVVRSNSKAVQDYLDGTESAVKFLVGQVMKATKGAADPNVARSVLLEYLEASQKGS